MTVVARMPRPVARVLRIARPAAGRHGAMLCCLLLSACAIKDSHIAARARHDLVGMREVDLEACLGVPDQHASFGGTDILTWYATSSSGLSYGVPLIGGISFSNGGNCHATARLESGRVTELRYTGEKNATGAPDAYCAPIVRSCVERPERPTPASPTAGSGFQASR